MTRALAFLKLADFTLQVHRELLTELHLSMSAFSDGGLSELFEGVPVPIPARCRGERELELEEAGGSVIVNIAVIALLLVTA